MRFIFFTVSLDQTLDSFILSVAFKTLWPVSEARSCDVDLISVKLASWIIYFTFSPQTYQISINLTTNERINKKRYVYLKGPSGIFLNPFDRGYFKNWLEYFHWVQPYDKKPNLRYNV